MKVRFSVNDRGELADRDGNVLGRLTSLTLEVANSGQLLGTTGVGLDLQGQRQEPETEDPRSPNASVEGDQKRSIEDAAIDEVYAYWRTKRPTAREEIPAGTHRQLKRALKAGYTVAQQQAMIDALFASDWHRQRPETLKLSTIFATKPGGKTFEDQLDAWLERSPSSPSPTGVRGPQTQARIDEAKWVLRRGADGEEREAAIEFLEQHGVRVDWQDDGYPTFAA